MCQMSLRFLKSVCSIILLVAGAAAQQAPPPEWGEKNWTRSEARARAHFPILVLPPSRGSNEQIQAVWAPKESGIPARQLVMTIYTVGKDRVYFLQARALPGRTPDESLAFASGQGFFKIEWKKDTIFRGGRVGSTDFYALGPLDLLRSGKLQKSLIVLK